MGNNNLRFGVEMSKVKLSYFDFSGGRGETCRLALYLGGVDFIDDRIQPKDWNEKKPSTPYGALPTLEIEGKGVLAQSNAILGLIGSKYNLLPEDDFEAAKHISILNAVEELDIRIGLTMKIKDEDLKKKRREELVESYMFSWASNLQNQIQGPYVAGEKISVADLKLFTTVRWVKKGVLDYIPANIFNDHIKLLKLVEAVENHPKVIEWYKN